VYNLKKTVFKDTLNKPQQVKKEHSLFFFFIGNIPSYEIKKAVFLGVLNILTTYKKGAVRVLELRKLI